MKKNINKKGFTLVETILVVAVITLVTGVTFVTIGNSLDKYRESAEFANNRQFPEAMLLTKEKILGIGNNSRIANALSGTGAGYAHSGGGTGGNADELTGQGGNK